MRRGALPGDIWRVDLGLAAKLRPVLILSDYPADDELALLVVVPHTTAVRGNRWELALPKPFLKPGVFHLQQVQPVPLARFEARLGALTEAELQQVRTAIAKLLHLDSSPRVGPSG
jgi:mRNA interferase MazF